MQNVVVEASDSALVISIGRNRQPQMACRDFVAINMSTTGKAGAVMLPLGLATCDVR